MKNYNLMFHFKAINSLAMCSSVIPFFSSHLFNAPFVKRPEFRSGIDFSSFPAGLLLHYSLCDRTRVLRSTGRRFNYLRSCFRNEMPYVKSLKIPFIVRRRLLALRFADKRTSISYKSQIKKQKTWRIRRVV